MPNSIDHKKRGGGRIQSICYSLKSYPRGSLYKLWAQLLDQFSREERAIKATERKAMASRDYGLRIEQAKRFSKLPQLIP